MRMTSCTALGPEEVNLFSRLRREYRLCKTSYRAWSDVARTGVYARGAEERLCDGWPTPLRRQRLLGTARLLGQTVGAALMALMFSLLDERATTIALAIAAGIALLAAGVSCTRLFDRDDSARR